MSAAPLPAALAPVRVPAGTRVSRVHLRRLADGEPIFTSAVVDRRDAAGDTWWRAELPVRNPVTPYRFLLGTTAGVRWSTTAIGPFGS